MKRDRAFVFGNEKGKAGGARPLPSRRHARDATLGEKDENTVERL